MKSIERSILGLLLAFSLLVMPNKIFSVKVPGVNWEIPLPDMQVSTWAAWHHKLIPVPRKVDSTSKVRIGGTGGGIDLTVRYFIPFYYGVLYEYMPVFSDTATPTVSGYGTVNTAAALYAHYFAGALYVPLGDWVWELFLEKFAARLGNFYESLLRSPYGKATYGVHYMYATLEAGSESSTTNASRVGYTLETGFMFRVYKSLRAYIAYDYHSIYEDSYYLLGFKAGVAYRHRFGSGSQN
jgi:hypothetical protein